MKFYIACFVLTASSILAQPTAISTWPSTFSNEPSPSTLEPTPATLEPTPASLQPSPQTPIAAAGGFTEFKITDSTAPTNNWNNGVDQTNDIIIGSDLRGNDATNFQMLASSCGSIGYDIYSITQTLSETGAATLVMKNTKNWGAEGTVCLKIDLQFALGGTYKSVHKKKFEWTISNTVSGTEVISFTVVDLDLAVAADVVADTVDAEGNDVTSKLGVPTVISGLSNDDKLLFGAPLVLRYSGDSTYSYEVMSVDVTHWNDEALVDLTPIQKVQIESFTQGQGYADASITLGLGVFALATTVKIKATVAWNVDGFNNPTLRQLQEGDGDVPKYGREELSTTVDLVPIRMDDSGTVVINLNSVATLAVSAAGVAAALY